MSEIKTLNGYSLADTKAREDIAALSEEIAELKGEGEAEKEPVTYIATITGIFSVSNKTILQGDGYGFHTDYIPLDGYTHIKATYKLTNTAYALAFFDESKNLIPDLSIIGEGTDKFYVIDMDVPAGAAYCMMSDYKWGATQGTGSITISGGSAKKDAGLTSEQIAALNEMFKVCAYASSAETAYAAFCEAFGISGEEA